MHSGNSKFRDLRLISNTVCKCRRVCSQCDTTLSIEEPLDQDSDERTSMLKHSRTLDASSSDNSSSRPRHLVRQIATEASDQACESDNNGKRLRVSGRMPSRQWTTDASFSAEDDPGLGLVGPSKAISSPMVMSSNSNAFLLRPVSRNSHSGNSTGNSKSNSNQEFDIKKNPAAKAAIAAAVAAAKNGCNNGAGQNGSSRNPSIHSGEIHSRVTVRKQMTVDSSVPSQHHFHMSTGGNLKQFPPRQHSTASAYSSMAIPSTYSQHGITLVRGASCSLVDIPTYLGPGSVGFATGKSGLTTSVTGCPSGGPVGCRPASRPRLQLDLTKRNSSATKNNAKKTKWTILCVGLTLLTMCVTLVGTMLSIGSQYQNLMVARKWENEFANHTVTSDSHKATSTIGLVTKFQADLTSLRPELTTVSTQKSTSLRPLLSILKISRADIQDHEDNSDKDQDLEDKEEEELPPASVGYRGKKLWSST